MKRIITRREFLKISGSTLGGTILAGWKWFEFDNLHRVANLSYAQPKIPNVLLIVLDTVRAKSLGLYGYERQTTPNLERLAKSGVVFKNAISTSPWTLPSLASMFTGRYPHELSANLTTPLDDTFPTLAEVLSLNGYNTAGFVANLFYCSYEFGLNRGFVHYEDYPVSPGQLILSSSLGRRIASSNELRKFTNYHELLNRKTASKVNSDFLRWLSHQDQQPFFAFLNYLDAHEPYLPPKPFNDKFGPMRPRGVHFFHLNNLAVRSWKWLMSPEEIQVELDAYEGAIAYIDHNLGLLFDELERRGILKNTLVIITSDHGEHFGEHGLFEHGTSLYRPLLHVPLLFIFQHNIPAGIRIPELVSLRDLPATILELLGISQREIFPGASLTRYWAQPSQTINSMQEIMLSEVEGQKDKKRYPVAKGDMKSLIAGGMHYIKNGDASEELYDFDNDHLEERDLSQTTAGLQKLEQFRSILSKLIKDSPKP